jgi:hypothetical protein
MILGGATLTDARDDTAPTPGLMWVAAAGDEGGES